MSPLFLFYCFLIGISATLGLGPMFIFTVNQTVVRGFVYGFSVALGAACADGLYFFLGFFGALQIIESHPMVLLGIEVIGGVVLISVGLYLWLHHHIDASTESTVKVGHRGIFWVALKAFLLTITNPFVLLYFLFVMVKIMPENIATLGFVNVVLGSIAGTLGALASLSSIAWGAKLIGRRVSEGWLQLMSRATAIFFIGIGLYFLVDTGIKYFWV